MQASTASIEFTPEEIEALAATRARLNFTQEERAEIERRQREYDKMIARLAATETLEEQQRLAEDVCPRFTSWVRARNRIRATPQRRLGARTSAAVPRRVNGSSGRPRAQVSRSSARSGDSGDDDSSEPASGQLTLDVRDLEERSRTTSEAQAIAWRRLEHLRSLQERGLL